MCQPTRCPKGALVHCAGLWALGAILLTELALSAWLPAQFSGSIVEERLAQAERGPAAAPGRGPARVLFLGDSLAAQILDPVLSRRASFTSLTTNGSVETAGNYYLLMRYLERHPAPRRVVLMTLNPAGGDLAQIYTENHVQRSFLRWSEIFGLSLQKRSLSFFLVMAAHKLLPSHRYQLHLRHRLAALTGAPLGAPSPRALAAQQGKVAATQKEWLHRLSTWLLPPEHPTIAAHYLEKMARTLSARGVPLVVALDPMSASGWETFQRSGAAAALRALLARLARLYPTFSALERRIYPDPYFRGTYLRPEVLDRVSRELEQDLVKGPP